MRELNGRRLLVAIAAVAAACSLVFPQRDGMRVQAPVQTMPTGLLPSASGAVDMRAWDSATDAPPPAPLLSASPSAAASPSVAPSTDAASGASPAAAPAPAPASAAPVTAAAVPVVTARAAAFYPFASTSVWNTAIGSSAIFESTSASRTHAFLGGTSVVNREQWSIAVRRTTSSDPWASLLAVRNGITYSLRIPADTMATGGSDAHVTLIQPDGITAYDAYKLASSGTNAWTAQYVVVTDLRGSGIEAGVRAAGVPAIAGVIRAQELAHEQITHALAIAIPPTMLKSGQVWPANREDTDAATSYSGTVPMGSLFAIPGSVDVSKLGLTPEGAALAHALQDYGAYVVDRSGMVSLYCELACDPAQTASMAKGWVTLYPLMRDVTNSSPSSVGGGGQPRVPPKAPPS